MTIKRKLLAVILLVTFIFCLLFGRLVFVEVISGNKLQAQALDEWTRDLPLGAKRGDIYDRNGNILASSVTDYTLYVRPNALKEHERLASIVSDTVHMDYDKVLSKVNKRGVSEVKVVSHLTHTEMTTIRSSHIDGVYFATGNARVYPHGAFASQILGFTNADNVGQTGIEDYYNHYLSGVDGAILHETDLVGREIPGGKVHFLPSISGNDIYLTLDMHIQSFAERVVDDAMHEYHAKQASCIVMDVDDGDIYAYAKAPTFDLNNIPRDNLDELFSRSKVDMVSSVYEPGSTFKILTSAIGLEEHAFGDDHRFYCPGYRIVDGKRIRCWKTIGHGSQTFGEGIENSCNCVFMDIATKVGTHTMYDYFRRFGLTNKTGIDIKGETTSLLLREDRVKNVDIARIGFGQAIAVTPIGMLGAECAVLNGGHKVTPHLLRSVATPEGIKKNELIAGEQIVSEDTSMKMREYLERVVSHGGGKNAQVPGYRIGGKTGTAQKYAGGTIASGKYISSFVGFAPMDDPKYAVLIIVDEPEGYKYYGSLVAAPFASDLFGNIFAYKSIAPTEDIDREMVTMPDIIGTSRIDANKTLKNAGISYEEHGDGGRVVYQFPAPGAVIPRSSVVFFEMA